MQFFQHKVKVGVVLWRQVLDIFLFLLDIKRQQKKSGFKPQTSYPRCDRLTTTASHKTRQEKIDLIESRIDNIHDWLDTDSYPPSFT